MGNKHKFALLLISGRVASSNSFRRIIKDLSKAIRLKIDAYVKKETKEFFSIFFNLIF